MAIDTEAKRRAAFNFLLTPWIVLPTADGSIDVSDRKAAFGVYHVADAEAAGPIRRRIRKAVIFGLESISTISGYNFNVGEANSPAKSFEQMTELRPGYAAINFIWGREVYKNVRRGSHSVGWLVKQAIVILDVYLKTQEDMARDRSKILADIEKYFLTNYWLPSEAGVGTAVETHVIDNQPWGLESNKSLGGITIMLQIDYGQSIVNPNLAQIGTAPSVPASKPASTPVSARENIRAAVSHQITQMTTANGYNYDYATDDDVLSVQQMKQFPFVNVVGKSESYMSATSRIYHDGLSRKTASYDLDVYVRDQEDWDDVLENVIADVEKRFMNNFNVADSNDKRTALSCMFTHNEPFGVDSNRPMHGVSFGLDIYYRQHKNDPTQTN